MRTLCDGEHQAPGFRRIFFDEREVELCHKVARGLEAGIKTTRLQCAAEK